MRILQLIDSLEAGGAERMAVNYANALCGRVEFSGLVSTRGEGPLKIFIDKQVSYLFLNKKSSVDIIAVRKLYKYCKFNGVTILHAHSSSIFIAVQLKFFIPFIKIIYHDHYGNSEFLDQRKIFPLKQLIKFCDGAIAVNLHLFRYIKSSLKFNKVNYLPNFSRTDQSESLVTSLFGQKGKRIVCVANLRDQKNHLLLLDVAKMIRCNYSEWTIHFIGKDFDDSISRQIKNTILEFDLTQSVYLYGSCQDTTAIIRDAQICVLSSSSEGLPVALLEYGMQKKAVVVTSVGEIPEIVQHKFNGLIVESGDVNNFYNAIAELILNAEIRSVYGENLYKIISAQYSEEIVMEKYIKWIKQC